MSQAKQQKVNGMYNCIVKRLSNRGRDRGRGRGCRVICRGRGRGRDHRLYAETR